MVVRKPNSVEDVICNWDLDDEPQSTFQISKAKGTSKHSLKHVGRGKSFAFSMLPIAFLPPDVASVVQPFN